MAQQINLQETLTLIRELAIRAEKAEKALGEALAYIRGCPVHGNALCPEEHMSKQVFSMPTELLDLVEKVSYRPGWTFELKEIDRGQGSVGLTLDIVTLGYNSYHPEKGETYSVHHYMPVPPAAYNRQSWQRWLFEQLLLVERHEACEFFSFVIEGDFILRDGTPTKRIVDKPYAPNHGPGWDPYIVTELTTDKDRRTSFKGEES